MSIRVTCKGADTLPIDALVEFQGALKTISQGNLDKLKRSILRHGVTAPIFVWQGADYHIIDGHQRLKALCSLREEGYDIPLLPVDYIEADSEAHAKEKLLYITSQYGEFTSEGFAEFTADVDFDFSDIRLTNDEFIVNFAQDESEVVEDDIPDVQDEIHSIEGEIYELGPHRLLCGDSTVEDSVKALLAGVSPLLMVTDPPYGVDYNPEWRADAGVNKNKGKMGLVPNDSNADWRAAYELFSGDVAYVWHAGRYASVVAESLEASGFEIRAQLIWAKDRFVFSRGHYHWHHEPCWYSVRNGSTAHWIGDRSQSTIWKIPARDDSGQGHGTQKPVECMARPIRNHDSEIVYDPFLGSGTTLIASAQIDRVCYGVELSPQYCDIIRRRWTKYARQNGLEEGSGALEPLED